MMECGEATSTDKAAFRSWLILWGLLRFGEEVPSFSRAYVVRLNNEPVATGSLYIDGTRGIFDEFLRSPHLSKNVAPQVINTMIQYLSEVAKGRGVTELVASPSTVSLVGRFKEAGWSMATPMATVLFKRLD